MKVITLDISGNVNTVVNHNAISIPIKYRDLFPAYRTYFTLRTDTGKIKTYIAGKGIAYPKGHKIQNGLRPWARKHDDLRPVDKLQIKIVRPFEIYELSIKKDVLDSKTFDIKNDISLTEGGTKVFVSERPERNHKLRKLAIKIHGLSCVACNFNFEQRYGECGKDFIEVHHIQPLGQNRKKRIQTNPETDLIVLCSNCHRMVHRKRKTTLTIDELKEKIKSTTANKSYK